MKKTILLSILSLIALVGFTSCEEDYSIIFPSFRGFKIDKTTLSAGDTLNIKGYISKKGQYLYKVKYYWSLDVDTISQEGNVGSMKLTYSIKSTTAKPISLNDEPTAYFVIPENVVPNKKNYKFYFEVEYEHAAAGTPVSHESNAEEGYLGGTFSYKALSTLYSKTTNTFTTLLDIK